LNHSDMPDQEVSMKYSESKTSQDTSTDIPESKPDDDTGTDKLLTQTNGPSEAVVTDITPSGKPSSTEQPAAQRPAATPSSDSAQSSLAEPTASKGQQENTKPDPSAPETDKPAQPSVASPHNPPAQAGASQGTGFTIQVASFQSAEAADKLLQELTADGFAAYTVRSETADNIWYRLRIGYYDKAEAAESIMSRLRAKHFDPLLIKL
jgi:cell division protein FtsN